MNTRSALGFVLLGLTSFLSTLPARADSAGMDAMLRANQAVFQQTSLRRRTTTTDASGETSVTTFEFVKPDRYHVQSSGSTGGSESIAIGQDIYQRRGAGAWRKMPAEVGRMAAEQMKKMRESNVTKEVLASYSITVTQIGPSSLNGAPMMVYATTYASSTTKYRSTGKFWIGSADNLPYQSEDDLESPVTKIGGKSFGGKSHSLTVYEYNLKIEIKAPI